MTRRVVRRRVGAVLLLTALVVALAGISGRVNGSDVAAIVLAGLAVAIGAGDIGRDRYV